MKITIPEHVNTILTTLRNAGYEAWIVGGCVRDALLNRTPKDWDITTNALPEEVCGLFRRTVPTGMQHGTVTVLVKGTGYEVTTYRVDGIYEDARHPKDVTFTKSLAEDLKRRDFTINAMAWNEEDGLVDLFEGVRDLENKTVRCVGDARERFAEDALRMMRAYRFAAQLGFSIEEETARAAKDLADTLQKISAERIRDELVKLLCSDHPERIRGLYEAGLTKQFLPEFDRCMETKQNNPYHRGSVGEHTVEALCAVRNDAALRITMLLHDIAKPDVKTTDEQGTDHFYNHAHVSAKAAAGILRRLKFDNKTIRRVKNLVEHHDITIGRELTPHTVRKMIHTVGKEDFPLLIEVMEADNAAKAEEESVRLREVTKTLREVYEAVTEAGDPVELKDLAVTGTDLIEHGIPAGKEIGDVLERMLKEVLRVPAHNTREYLLDAGKLKHFRAMLMVLAVVFCMAAGGLRAYAQSGDGASGGTTDAAAEAETQDAGGEDTQEESGGQTVITMVGKYDSADLACVIYVNEAQQKITLHNHDTGRSYTLEYDSGTRFIDAYGRETNPQVLQTGDLAYVTFLKSSKHLNSLKMSADGEIWRYEDQRNYTLPVTLSAAGPTVSSMATISGKRYLMDVRTLVLVEGEKARPSAIVEGDLITAWGEGNEVYCVQVTRGHGWLRLSSDTVNDVSLVGAWIELDNSVIRKITPRMLVTAPEGTYTLYIIGNGANYSTEVTIERGKETIVDTSGIPIEKPKQGKVRFSVTPQDAKIRVDDKPLGEGEDSITLEYGLHTLELTADGYVTMFRYLRVGSPNAVVKLEMEKSENADASSGSSSSPDGSSSSGNSSSSGDTSSSGDSGSSGNTSSSGDSGSSGNTSSSGDSGSSGNTSSSGDSGSSGNTSSSGDSGSSGNTSSSGTSSSDGGSENSGNTDSGNGNNTGDSGNTGSSGNTGDSNNGANGSTQPEEAGQGGIIATGRIYVDAPAGAAFYLDGNFVGFVPVSFEKTGGIHTVTLSQEGKRTISYNIELDNSKSDKTFNFPAMEPE